MDNDDNNTTAGDTLSKMGSAVADDAAATVEDVKDAGEWVKEKASDGADAVENAAEAAGVNHGDPHNNND